MLDLDSSAVVSRGNDGDILTWDTRKLVSGPVNQLRVATEPTNWSPHLIDYQGTILTGAGPG
ncbi:MAG: hypothetical protein V2I33_22840, partial [Kangiellaceae bacterium]|nr:hypothetical protein [Kangiellaceae bacterium]